MNKYQDGSKTQMWLLALVLAGVVAGCGGGSGSNSGSGAGSSPSPSSSSSSSAGPNGAVCTGADCVMLGAAANYVILVKTGVSSIPNSAVTGSIGVSPAARPFLTGWSLISEPTDTYFTSAQVAAPGKLYAADNVGGTTAVDLTTAVGDMQTAYTNANGMAPAGGALAGGVPGTACPGAGGTGDLGGQTISPGVYTCTVTLNLAAGTNVTLNGAGVYVIRTTQGINQASGTQVILTGGALAQNVFWVPAQTMSIVGTAGATTKMAGVVLAKTNIVVGTNATVNGRLMAQTAVTLDQSTITMP